MIRSREQQLADHVLVDIERREAQFEQAARAAGLANDHDLHREDGAYSMPHTRKLLALFLTGIAVADH